MAFTSMTDQPGLHQKRHNSNSVEYYDSTFVKRRPGGSNGEVDLPTSLDRTAAQYLDSTMSSPSKNKHEKTPSISRQPLQLEQTPQPRGLDNSAEIPESPFYLPTTSQTNVEAAANVNENNSIRRSDSIARTDTVYQDHSGENRCYKQNSSSNEVSQSQPQVNSRSSGQDQELNGSHYVVQNGGNRCPDDESEVNKQSGFSGNNNTSQQNDEDRERDDQNNRTPSMKTTGQQQLVEKLQEIYKNIVKQESDLQDRCSALTTQQTTDLKKLWQTYKINSDLIDNYILFINTALLSSQSESSLAIGQEIVEVYRIERRLWVYGTITFLDVLKNFSNFMDPEVSCQFITYVFISLSNMLGELPSKYSIPWLERLGDLSRMAIALYPSGFVDWKLSAEHWYRESLKYTFGHGKLYYHMSTVQQNTLEAFVNLGKSVFCEDTFVPSAQYMQLVIDNIYQRAFAERGSVTHRNNYIVDYLKHTEVMLLPSFLESTELQNVVIHFFQYKFGVSSCGNFFDPNLIFIQDGEKMKHFFRHSSLFAQSHILQLCGFGDAKSPFAMLFELSKHLKSRKERKERKKSTKFASTSVLQDPEDIKIQTSKSIEDYFLTIDSSKVPYEFPLMLDIWKRSLQFVNVTSMKCGMVVLRRFLYGPIVTALPHLLPWLYFIVSVQMKLDQIEDSTVIKFWIVFMRRIIPWDSLVTFVNTLVHYCVVAKTNSFDIDSYMKKYMLMDTHSMLATFYENENLPECWNCWGTLWFDVICRKSGVDITSLESTGVAQNCSFLDPPMEGIAFGEEDESGQKYWERICRVFLLFKSICDWGKFSGLGFGCVQTNEAPNLTWKDLVFKFNDEINDLLSVELYPGENESFPFEKFEVIGEMNMINNMISTPRSMIPGISVENLEGFRILYPDYPCFNKNGNLITGSLYTRGPLESGNIQGGDDFNVNKVLENGKLMVHEKIKYSSVIDQQEGPWMDAFMNPEFRNQEMSNRSFIGNLNCQADTNVTFFVLDATTWLRHFAHIYKLATNNVLKFAICLTTFQELRFLRKSKDESVLEAATRAVITVRQLYHERKLLALRFTGNVAGHLEEHLEIEEQMTWKSHVDEFVIEAIAKAQSKFNLLNKDAMDKGKDFIPISEEEEESTKFNFVSLVTDDYNMRTKAQQLGIRTFTTRFVFAICTELGREAGVCTN